MQCTAKSKRSGERCKRHAVTGYTVCQMHGAGSPKQGRPGGVNKRFIEGRYSKILPYRILARYEAAKNDPELLAMSEEIGLLDARIGDVLSRVDTGEAGAAWASLQAASEKLNIALAKQDNVSANLYLAKMQSIINKGSLDYAAWFEVSSLIEQRRKLVESERRRLVQMKAVVSIDEAMGIIKAMYDLVKNNADRETFEKVKAGFVQLVAGAGDAIRVGEQSDITE